MMVRILAAGLAILFLLLANGCSYNARSFPRVPLAPPPGFVFTQIKAPLSLDYAATASQPPKTGSAMTHYVGLPFYDVISFAWNDTANVETAARNGGITEIEYADYELLQVLGVYSQFTVHAYGR